ISTNGTFSNEYVAIQQDDGIIDALWNNRTAGNNVLKFEFEIYGSVFFYSTECLFSQGDALILMDFVASTGHRIQTSHSSGRRNILKNYNATTFPYNIWIKAELFIDYN